MNQILIGKIISVGDGDTFRFITEDGEKKTIRLAYIDAPELRQPGGIEARQKLKEFLAIDSIVKITPTGRDLYKRVVGVVYLDGILINLEIVACGSAVFYRNYLSRKHHLYPYFKQAESLAKHEKIGFWSYENNLMPWTYRKNIKDARKIEKKNSLVAK